MSEPIRLPQKPLDKSGDSCRFLTEYTHYRTKKVMRAKDYGYKAWPIRCKAK
jgi:hypothetical protein